MTDGSKLLAESYYYYFYHYYHSTCYGEHNKVKGEISAKSRLQKTESQRKTEKETSDSVKAQKIGNIGQEKRKGSKCKHRQLR